MHGRLAKWFFEANAVVYFILTPNSVPLGDNLIGGKVCQKNLHFQVKLTINLSYLIDI